MPDVQEKVVITGDASGLDKAAAQVDRASSKMAKSTQSAIDKAMAYQARLERQLSPAMSANARAQEQLSKVTASYARDVERMRQAMDPAYKAQRQMAEAQRKLNHEIAAGRTTAAEGATILAGYQDRVDRASKSLGGVQTASKLASHEMTNLSRQGGDVITMFSMGASAQQVFVSQAAQVYDAISSGPGGLGGGFQRLKGSIAEGVGAAARMAAGLNPIGVAFGVAGAAALTYALATRREMRPVSEIIDDQNARIKALADAWDLPIPKMEEYAKRSRAALQFDVESGAEEARNALGQKASKMMTILTETVAVTDGIGGVITTVTPKFEELAGAIEQFGESSKDGSADFKELDKALSELAISTPNRELRDFIKTTRDARIEGINLQAAVEAGADTMKDFKRSIPTFTGNEFDLMSRMDPTGFDAIRDGLKAQSQDLTQASEKTDEYGDAVTRLKAQMGDTVRGLETQIATYGLTEGAAAALRFETEALADAERIAAEAKRAGVDPAIKDEIHAQAQAVGELTQRLHDQAEAQALANRQKNLRENVDFERSIAGMPSAEQAIARQLNSAGFDKSMAEYDQLAAKMRETTALNDAQSRSQKGLQKELINSKDLFGDLAKAMIQGFGKGEDAIDGVIGVLATIGGPIASMDKLFEGEGE